MFEMEAACESPVVTSELATMQPGQQPQDLVKKVRFNENVEVLPLDVDETDEEEDEQRWFSQDDISSFRDDAIRTVHAVRANEEKGEDEPLDEEEFCLRGLEQKMLKRPPPNFVKRVLQLQRKLRMQTTKNQPRRRSRTVCSLSTSLQLFSEACSKWARKRAVQLAAEDEYEAYQIFMAGLRKQQSSQYSNVNDDDDDGDYDDDAYYEEEEFDFCTEGEFVHDVYDYKFDPTEDETEYDDSDAFEPILAVNKDGSVSSSGADYFLDDDRDVEDDDLLFDRMDGISPAPAVVTP